MKTQIKASLMFMFFFSSIYSEIVFNFSTHRPNPGLPGNLELKVIDGGYTVYYKDQVRSCVPKGMNVIKNKAKKRLDLLCGAYKVDIWDTDIANFFEILLNKMPKMNNFGENKVTEQSIIPVFQEWLKTLENQSFSQYLKVTQDGKKATISAEGRVEIMKGVEELEELKTLEGMMENHFSNVQNVKDKVDQLYEEKAQILTSSRKLRSSLEQLNTSFK
jgi:hypothetical protein